MTNLQRARMSRRIIQTAFAALLAAVFAAADDRPDSSWKILFEDGFEAADFDRWEQSDQKAWRLVKQKQNQVANQFQQSQVETPVRSPFNRAVVKDLVVSDVQLDVDLQSTARDYPHRSLCLFFGYQDPAHMYYVHLGQKTDEHANQIFIVNGEPRKKISTSTTPGTPWDNDWHHVRIIRRVNDGTIEVYFDDLEKPAMTATDKTFPWGQVGIGSFDDTGNFDNFVVRGIEIERPAK